MNLDKEMECTEFNHYAMGLALEFFFNVLVDYPTLFPSFFGSSHKIVGSLKDSTELCIMIVFACKILKY